MAAKMPEPNYVCEVCGLGGLNEDSLRSHMTSEHLEGAASCPFCEFRQVSHDELLIHINTVHLDCLSPDTEDIDFIDADVPEKKSCPDSKSAGCNLKNINLCSNINSNVNNINNNNNYNTNGVPTSSGSGSEESPLRMQLNLSLRKKEMPPPIDLEDRQKCMMCGFYTNTPAELEEHINRVHFDLTSPTALSSTSGYHENFSCPLCVWSFQNSRDLEVHVNEEHRDILSPIKSTPGNLDNWSDRCPVCYRSSFDSSQEMVAHIDEHFNIRTPVTPDLSSDRLLAKEIDKREKESMREREQKEFEQLQAQYGMDNQGNFKEQSLTNMQKAVYAGEMSVSDFYERQIGLRFAENSGIDDGSSCTRDLIQRIRAISQVSSNVVRAFTCTTVDHYASTYGDEGWGCGYRNLQMMMSSLLYHPVYNEKLCKSGLMGGSHGSGSNIFISKTAAPSISRLQQHIEWAWRQGFDEQGCEQLGGKVHNTRKWIGATEIVTALCSIRIRCLLVDFDRPTGPDGSHPQLFNWVLDYFRKYEDFKPPLYLQHHGHSRTIVGIEEFKDGHLTLLVFDPSHSPEQMYQFKNTATGYSGMKLIRKTMSTMKARQYQLVAVIGIMESESEYQSPSAFAICI
ncbi:hypothetical protein RUM44_010541 [Polyplax serrata]|uniref:Zinc finger-containing ubiquitin peptidase 1 n=1 Tax=Polyplax serrata TaxID=468196 RepID=A0ABR1AVS8_POLSC